MPVPLRKSARSSQAAIVLTAGAVSFCLRIGGGLVASGCDSQNTFLHLHSSLPIATPAILLFNPHVTETSLTSNSQKRREFIKEALRIEEATMHSSKGHFAAAAIWRGMHVGLGIPTTILASIVAASAFSKMDSTHSIGGWISILVAVLAGVTTFLNPPAKANAHFTAGNNYGALRDKTRIYRTIDCLHDSDDALTKRLQELCEGKNELNQKSPQIPWFGRHFAKRGIVAGEAAYEVDKSSVPAN